ncbi:MAG TPA: RsmE family RNA methyltransferase [Gemmatimonadales bacterium]
MRVLIQAGSGAAGQRVSLGDEEVHHLRVRRAREDEGVEVLDGAGLVGTGRLVRVGTDWMVDIQTAERQTRRPELTLAVAAGDRERFSWMAEKAVELGVTAIVPLDTERTSGVASRLRAVHLGKLRRLVLEATKQCGAAWVPLVDAPVRLSDFLSRPVAGHGWLADVSGGTAPADLDESPLSVVIGPEGGFTSEERTALVDAGYQPVVLGSHTLRFETAALAAAAVAATARMRGSHG